MSRQIKQFRYYGEQATSKNYPTLGTYAAFLKGSAFSECMPVIHLGIQAPSGTKFYLNNSDNAIVVGYTGIYEIDVEDLTEITSLSFNVDSLQQVGDNDNFYIIVDLVYEQEDEE